MDTDKPTEVQREIENGKQYFLQAFSSKRFANPIQEQAVETLIIVHGIDKFQDGVKWAAKIGMSRGRAVVSLESALPRWKGAKGNGSKLQERDRSRYKEWDTPERHFVEVYGGEGASEE